MSAEIDAEIDEAFSFALESPLPQPGPAVLYA
jgi:hypothetical protein